LLAAIAGAVLTPAIPAHAADGHPDLSVRIAALSPSWLSAGATVTMSGTVTNHDNHAWTNLQAYLVIPASPFTTHAQIQEAIDNGNAYTGVRVIDQGMFDDMGDLAPGKTLPFQVEVPYGTLGITGAEGVYPVGVQILATDTEGTRSPDAVARATTFLPMISSQKATVPASVVWPFLMPDHRGVDGDYTDPKALLTAVSAGGQLRNLLDLATNTGGNAGTVLIDPALLVGVDDLARKRHLADSFEITEAQQAEADLFLQDLLSFARAGSCWVLGFDRPDDLALVQNRDISKPLVSAVDTATEAVLTTYQLSGRRVSWPSRKGVTSSLLTSLRGAGDSPAIVTPGALPGWDRRQGSLVKYVTSAGPMPLLVNDVVYADVPGQSSVVTLRQRILSDAALAILQRTIDPDSRADAVTMVDSRWNPGTQWAQGRLEEAFNSPFTYGTSLDELLTRSLGTYSGTVAATSTAKPVSRAQLEAAADIITKGNELRSVSAQSAAVDDELAVDVASVLGMRWRSDRDTGIAIARTHAAKAGVELRKIRIEGPPSVTLSSSSGGFPLTIKNGTDEAIRVGVSLDSSNPALTIPDVKPVEIGAGERHTLTVNIDLGRQNTTTLTAWLISADGKQIGDPSEDFNVRSSNVGLVLWVAMGLAALLVLAALVRRFRRRQTLSTRARLADDYD
jgi:hypothetical protein